MDGPRSFLLILLVLRYVWTEQIRKEQNKTKKIRKEQNKKKDKERTEQKKRWRKNRKEQMRTIMKNVKNDLSPRSSVRCYNEYNTNHSKKIQMWMLEEPSCATECMMYCLLYLHLHCHCQSRHRLQDLDFDW